jgi:hypothetical protein
LNTCNKGGTPGHISIATISTSSVQQPGANPTSTTTTNTPRPNPTHPTTTTTSGQANINNNPIAAQLNSLLFGGAANIGGGGGGGGPANNFLNQLLGNFTSTGNAQQRPQPTTAQPQPQQQRAQSAAMGAILTEAMGLMDSNNPNDQRLNQPIRDFFRMFGADFVDEDETSSSSDDDSSSQSSASSAMGVFNVFFSALSLGDMISMARGGGMNNPGVYERARQPMRDYLRRACCGADSESTARPTAAQIAPFVHRLHTEMFEEEGGMNVDFARLEPIDATIDLRRTFATLITHHLTILIEHIFDAQYDQSETPHMWSLIFNRKVHELIDHVVAMWRVCVRNGDATLTETIMDQLRATMTSQNFMAVGGAFLGIFESFSRGQIQSLLGTVPPISRRELEQFIVYKGQEVAACSTGGGGAANVGTTSVEETKKTTVKSEGVTATPQSASNLMSVDDEADQYDSASSTLSSHSMDIDQQFSDAMDQMLKRKKHVVIGNFNFSQFGFNPQL